MLLAFVIANLAGPALAQPDLFSRETIAGVINVRGASADGEESWLDGGFGKSRFGDETTALVDGVIEWRPKLSWSLSAVADVIVQPDLDEDKIDLNEAFVLYKPLGSGKTRVQGRLGFFYPPVSLEHDGKGWTTTRTITPSAINSWIGEETFGAGLEISVKRDIAGHEVGLTVAGFDKNDTAGTLLSLRGWSLNDTRAGVFGERPLPPLSTFISYVQPRETYPARELDDRFGYYIRADWRSPAGLSLNAIYYDNLGDMLSVDQDMQWSWYTRFVNVGAAWRPTEHTELLAQWMTGVTRMGYTTPAGRWIDVDFDSAYVLASQTFGANALTGRLDYFRVDDEAAAYYGDLSETGWAATAAWRRTLSPHAEVFVEALHTSSDRWSRVWVGEAATQRQTTIQGLVRFSF
jgi:hypothetical protein